MSTHEAPLPPSGMTVRQPVFLTFDDGPDPYWTPRILDLLAQAGAYASFFVIGEQAQRSPQLLRRIAVEGHAVGNHTYSHRHPWLMTRAEAVAQVRNGRAAIADILGCAPAYYRAPHGRQRRCMILAAHACGETVVHWQVSAMDWGPFGSASRIAGRLRRVRPNDIVLMHDGRNRHNRPEALVQVLPGFLETLAERGIRSAALSL